ncbi:MAG: DNA gyrase modulator, partial [Firmicutes bacterium]|nr:DNA gyrase modulator [Bacillota bacterium]
MNLKDIKEIAMKAPQLGAQAEIFVMRSQSLELAVSDQKLENMDKKNSQGVGVRTLIDGRMGFAFSTVLSKASVEQVLRQAIENAKVTAPDQYNILPAKNVAIGKKESLCNVSFEEKLENIMLAEKKAKEYDSRIVKVQRAGYSDSLAEIMLASSEGVEAEYTNSYYSAYVSSQAEDDGNVEEGSSYDVARAFSKLNFRDLGEESADKAVSMLGAKPIASQKIPLILD